MTEQGVLPSSDIATEDVTQHGDGLSHLHLSNSSADTAIRPQAWCGRRGRPVVFLPFLLPQCEGVVRQGRRATDFAVAARVLPGDLAQEA